jgi:hypothetical protein
MAYCLIGKGREERKRKGEKGREKGVDKAAPATFH